MGKVTQKTKKQETIEGSILFSGEDRVGKWDYFAGSVSYRFEVQSK
jgi:hypothetical protein